MISPYAVAQEDVLSAEAQALMSELSEVLVVITGDSGKSSFDPRDVCIEGGRFVVARTSEGTAVGCGALRPLQAGIAELKRMYARPGHRGAGSAILAHLENAAGILGYAFLWLETRAVNERAVQFYLRHNFQKIPNYGKYVGNAEAVCLGKCVSDA